MTVTPWPTGEKAFQAVPDPTVKCTILHLDDDVSCLNSLKRVLRKEPYDIVSAVDGYEAVQRLQHHPEIGLVIIDVSMPGLNGLSVLKLIRQLRPELPALVLSGLQEESVWQLLSDSCVQGYCSKTSSPAELCESILTVLAQAEAEQTMKGFLGERDSIQLIE